MMQPEFKPEQHFDLIHALIQQIFQIQNYFILQRFFICIDNFYILPFQIMDFVNRLPVNRFIKIMNIKNNQTVFIKYNFITKVSEFILPTIFCCIRCPTKPQDAAF